MTLLKVSFMLQNFSYYSLIIRVLVVYSFILLDRSTLQKKTLENKESREMNLL